MSENTRQKILISAAEVVSRSGAANLTLDGVAVNAKISKGGLLYYFPSKRALILALIEGEIARFDDACQALRNSSKAGSYTRAYLRATFADDAATASGVLSAIASDASLLEPLRQAYGRWQAALEDDGDPVIGTLVRLVADGFWFSVLVGAPPIRPALLEELVVKLYAMTEGDDAYKNA